MIRFGKTLVLIGFGALLCSCSSRHDTIHAEFRQQPPIKDGPKYAVTRQGIEPAGRNNLGDNLGDITSSIGPTSNIRPWPKRGTPEWDQIQSEEIAREQRIKDVLSSICRGC
jgi:hypothetical protein